MESALMMTPPSRSASASASADLPLAVGPAISTALCRVHRGRSVHRMTHVATLIANPATPALDDAALDARARGAARRRRAGLARARHRRRHSLYPGSGD